MLFTRLHPVILGALLLLTGLTSTYSHAGLTSMGDAINIAGRQRMLSQRIAQSYLLTGMNPASESGAVQLQRAVKEFDQNLTLLSTFAPAQPLANQLKEVEAAWQPYRELSQQMPSKEHAQQLLQHSDELLTKAHQYVVYLEQLSGTKQAEIINLSGRQRMLSQRIAKNFLASHWGIADEKTKSSLYEDMAEYENVLSYLEQSDINTDEIRTQLAKVKGQYHYASRGFDGAMSLSGPRLIHVVTGTTDAMLRGMDITTKMYAKQLGN